MGGPPHVGGLHDNVTDPPTTVAVNAPGVPGGEFAPPMLKDVSALGSLRPELLRARMRM